MANERSEVLIGNATVYIGTAGSTAAADLVGFTDGVEMTIEESNNKIMCDSENFPIKVVTTEQGATFKIKVMQPTLDNMVSFTQGASRSGGTVTFSTSSDSEISLKLVGKDASGTDRIIDVPYVRPEGGWGMTFQRGENQFMEVNLIAIKDEDETGLFTISDATSSAETLASDTFAWTSGQLLAYVTSETSTADDLVTITAGAATSASVITIIPAAGHTITVKETGNIALAGSDITLALSGSDRLQVRYNGSDKWAEIARITFV